MDQYASVTAAAKALDVSVDTIRRWNKLGLIKAIRDKNQRRLFNLAKSHVSKRS